MSLRSDLDQLFADGKQRIVKAPLTFKAKLGIGAQAYALLRARENMTTFTEALGIGSSVAAMANSSVIASAFFANTGLFASALSAIGLGTAAVTPIGWVIAAGAVSGATYLGVSRLFEKFKDTQLIVVPKYINTPLDIIAVALIQAMLPVCLKIAKADGEIRQEERDAICDHFSDDWGYCPDFVTRMVDEYENQVDLVSYTKLAEALNEYCTESKDCNQQIILSEFMSHLREIVEADGVIHEKEARELEHLSNILIANGEKTRITTLLESTKETVSNAVRTSSNMAISVAEKSTKTLGTGFDRLSRLVTRSKEPASTETAHGAEDGSER